MKANVTLTCKGLYTYPNNLGAIPNGGLIEADNIYIDRPDIAEPRRGFKIFTANALTTVAKSLHNYQNRILVHQSTKLQYETDPTGSPGSFTTYQESINGALTQASVISPDDTNGLRIKSTTANKNFYFTSSKGIRKIDGVTNSILKAGVPQALDFDLSLIEEAGFLEQNNTIAYRVVWGIKDANNNLNLGSPSQPEVIYYYGTSQFITDLNGLITNLVANSPPLTKTYTPSVDSTATLSEIYDKMKAIVKNLNQEGLTSTSYEAGGTLNKTAITFKSKNLSTASSYLLFQDATGTTYYLWVNKSGADPAPDPNVQADLRLDYVGIEMDISAVVDPTSSAAVAAIAQTAISGSAAEVNLDLSSATLTISTYEDAVVTATADGNTPTTYFITSIETGSVLKDTDLTLANLQTGFDNIIELLNNETTLTINTPFIEARTTKQVQLDHITIPAEIINLSESGTEFFYQLYRSRQFPLSDVVTIVPDDELQLVYENTPTSDEIAQGYVGPIIDITTEDFRATGALLYTNPSQEGILQSNDRPPFALDITTFKNITFYGNTHQAYSLQLSLLTGKESTGANDPGFSGGVIAKLINQGLTYTSKLSGTIGNSTTIHLVNPMANAQPLTITVVGQAITASLATNGGGTITTTANLLKAAINANTSARALVYVTGSGSSALTALGTTNLALGTASDKITFTKGSDSFSISFVDIAEGNNFQLGYIALQDETDSTTSQLIDTMARNIIKAVNREEDNTFLEAVYLSGFDTTPGQILFRNRNVYDSAFTIASTTNEVEIAFNPNLGSSTAVPDNQTNVNYLYYSKGQQPETVPQTNFIPIGSANFPIMRILALRDSLIVLKSDGIFRVTGTSTETLQENGFDNTAIILAPDTAVAGNNQIFALSTQGVVRITESDVGIISRPIEDKINALLSLNLYPYLQSASHAVFYTTERKYYLWVPDERDDTTAAQCFVYNIFTETWTRLPIEKTCALINLRDNRLYLGPGDVLHVEQERKNYDVYDYADRQISTNVTSQDGDTIVLQSVSNITEGDVIEQIQYVTTFDFDRLLLKLDNDIGIADFDYYSTLNVDLKSEIAANLNSLADKLDADTGVTDTNYRSTIDAISGSTPVIIQQKYNALVNKLNADSGVTFNDYDTITQNPVYYTHILSVDEDTDSITIQDDNLEFDAGAVTIYNHIDTLITWAPNHAGAPNLSKQFSEASILTRNIVSRKVNLAFASDISQDFENIEFTDDTLAGWDRIAWGSMPWGSSPEPRAFRTYIPTLKQRCRYISTQFSHSRALENYLLEGVSLSYGSSQQRITR